MKKTFILSLFQIFLVSQTYALVTQNYQVNMVAQDENSNSFFFEAISGWNCSARSSLSFSEDMKNHKGHLSKIQQTGTSNFSFDTRWNGQPSSQMNFKLTRGNDNPKLTAELTHRCEKRICHDERQYYRDANGKKRYDTVEVCETEYFSKTWHCDIEQFSHDQSYRCDRVTSAAFPPTLSALFLDRSKDIKVRLHLSRGSSQEEFLYDNCGNSPRQGYVMNVSQGMGGHVGEDDYELNVEMNNEKVTIPTRTGLINGDLRYCPKENESKLKVKISGVERDAFCDDHYRNDKQEEVFDLGSQPETREVPLMRQTYFGNLFTPKISMVKIKLTPPSNR